MSVWRVFFWESANICDPGSHGAIDATFFDRETGSRHYQHHPDRHRRHSSIQTRVPSSIYTARHTSPTTRKLAVEFPFMIPRNRYIGVEKGYDGQSLRDAFRSKGVWPLLRQRLFTTYDNAHNARLDSELYGKPWMAETIFPTIKRRFDPAVHLRTWSRSRVDCHRLQPRTRTQTVMISVDGTTHTPGVKCKSVGR